MSAKTEGQRRGRPTGADAGYRAIRLIMRDLRELLAQTPDGDLRARLSGRIKWWTEAKPLDVQKHLDIMEETR